MIDREHLISEIGENLRALRQARGLEQEELAEKVGLTQGYIGAIERGEKSLSAVVSLSKLAEALNADVRLLLSRKEMLEKSIDQPGRDRYALKGDSGSILTSTREDIEETEESEPGNPVGDEEDDREGPVEHQSADEAQEILYDHLGKYGVSNNLLVGKNVILSPPFSPTVSKGNEGLLSVEIEGDRESPSGDLAWSTKCHEVIATRFRRNALYFLKDKGDAEPTREVLVPLQESRWNLLNTVPIGGEITKEEFIDRTRKDDGSVQTDAPRRWRELGNEWGFNTETVNEKYRRGPDVAPVDQPEPRPDMSALNDKFGAKIYSLFNERCNICGQQIDFNDENNKIKGGVVDHRIPVPFGGTDTANNLQLLCTTCNNRKKRRYTNDPDTYLEEYKFWAYPEEYANTLQIELSTNEANALSEQAEERGVRDETLARQMIKKALD